MIQTSSTISSTTLNLLNNVINKEEVDNRHEDKEKNLPIFFSWQRHMCTDYLIFNTKKSFNLLENAFSKHQYFIYKLKTSYLDPNWHILLYY